MNITKYAVVLVLLFHGIGHALGFLASWTKLPMGFVDQPWVFGGNIKIDTAVGRIFGVFWLVALVGFISAGIGVWGGQEWWTVAALWSSAISIVAIIPWWNAVTPSARIWPILVDVLVLIALLGPWKDRLIGTIR